jgi:Response regulator of the LytR/AlgR family
MKKILIISYWAMSILLLAFVLVSLGYRFMESVFIASLFLPGALAVKYLFPKVSYTDRTKGIINTIYITVGIIIVEILLFLVAHWCISQMRTGTLYDWPELPAIMFNPVFIAIMIAVLSVGDYYFEKWLDKRFPSEEMPVTFLSDRKQVSLMRDEILYIESNDSITTVYATQNRSFKNKTPISQWENYLGEGFIRIHRSYLVNAGHLTGHDNCSVTVDDTELPVSRKYKDAVKSL